MKKYLTIKQVNAKIKHLCPGLQLVQYKTPGGNYFGFLDLAGNSLDGVNSVMVHRLWHLSMDQWVEVAEFASEQYITWMNAHA